MPQQKQLFFILFGGTLLLLGSPLFVFFSGWQWQPYTEIPAFLYPLYLVTETGTIPYALMTCVVFACIPLLYLKLPVKKIFLYLVIVVAYLAAGQIVKETMKNVYQEARPYVAWLETENIIRSDDFYAMKRKERAVFMLEQDFSKYSIPSWQQNHWSKETGYSFPSGHSMFAAQWLLLYLILLWRRKAYLPIGLMCVWATGMEISRMVLGMHWAIDVFVSCLLATILIYPVWWCYHRYRIAES